MAIPAHLSRTERKEERSISFAHGTRRSPTTLTARRNTLLSHYPSAAVPAHTPSAVAAGTVLPAVGTVPANSTPGPVNEQFSRGLARCADGPAEGSPPAAEGNRLAVVGSLEVRSIVAVRLSELRHRSRRLVVVAGL